MSLNTIDQMRVYYEQHGPANGPLAVLIHGWSSSSFTWKPLLQALTQRYRCITIDLPGFGMSPAPAGQPSISGYADLVARIIAQHSERAALVLGHSMGGQIGATLALRHRPSVERLVLLNPAISGRLSTRVNLLMKPHVYAERIRLLEWALYWAAKTPFDYTDWLLKPTNFAERAQVSEEDYRRIRADARRQGQGRMRALCFNAMQHGDLRGKLAQIDAPALVIWGAEDNIVPLRDAGVVATEWPAADLRLVPNAGHWPQFEQTDITLRHIAHFLGLPPVIEGEQPAIHDPAQIEETANFLNNSELGGNMTATERLRLAELMHLRRYTPNALIASAGTRGDEMYVVRNGTLDIWLTPAPVGGRAQLPVQLAELTAGQVAGELALLDNATRSADMRAGPLGATVLALTRSALTTLAEDDPQIGMKMMQNLATSLGRRLRTQNWRTTNASVELAHELGG